MLLLDYFNRFHVADVDKFNVPAYPLDATGEHPAWAHLDERIDAMCDHVLNGLLPLDAIRNLGD